MSILLHPADDHDEWMTALRAAAAIHAPDQTIDLFPNVSDPAAVEFLVAWTHAAEDLTNYPNLRAILCSGAGIEQFLDPAYGDIPVVRLADTVMSDEMAQYALAWMMHFQRRFDVLATQQTARVWEVPPYQPAGDHVVGILGYGTIGRHIATAARALGYPTAAWSRSGTDDPAVHSFAGRDELPAFLAASSTVVNVLPATTETAGLISTDAFAAMADDAVFINIGRGATVDEDAVIAALDAGHLRAAVLDVTTIEPLPADSPLWTHPQVVITPHVAGSTQKHSAAQLIAQNIGRMLRGEVPYPLLDRSRGY